VDSLFVERIASEAALAELEPEWLELERSSGNTLPFRTFTWVACWWKHMREGRLALKDSLAIRAVRDGAGHLVGVAPLMLTERPGVGPIRARCLHFIGADPNMTEIRGALCRPDLEGACHAAILESLSRWPGEHDWVHWTGIDERRGAREAFGDRGAIWGEGVACYVLPLPATWEELRSSRPSNLRESLRKCYSSLRRDGLHTSFEVVTEGDRVGLAVKDFLRLHAARARLEDTVRHNDVFADAACRAFLSDVCERLAARGALRIFRLKLGDDVIATRLGFVLGGSLYLYYSGFDPTYAGYGVATTTVAEAMKHAIREGLKSVNLSTGKDRSKLRWRPEEVAFREALVVSSTPLGQVKYGAFSTAERAMGASFVRRYAQRLFLRRGSSRSTVA
jgi:CelD/BcsL family acetyltransferase involved in cellulose biosynthesis